jgi:hypothetical protein
MVEIVYLARLPGTASARPASGLRCPAMSPMSVRCCAWRAAAAARGRLSWHRARSPRYGQSRHRAINTPVRTGDEVALFPR